MSSAAARKFEDEQDLLHSKRCRWERLLAREESSKRTRSVFAALLSKQRGSVLHESIVSNLAKDINEVEPSAREEYAGTDPFSESGRIPVDANGIPYNHPLSEAEQRVLDMEAQEKHDRAESQKRQSKIITMWLRMRQQNRSQAQQSRSIVNWNRNSVDPATIMASSNNTVENRAKILRKISGGESNEYNTEEELEGKLERKVERRLCSVFEQILRIGNKCAQRGLAFQKEDESGQKSKNSSVAPRRIENRSKNALKALAQLEAAKHEHIMKSDFSDSRHAASVVESLLTIDICTIDDASWAKQICEFRQRTSDILKYSPQPTFGRPLHHDVFDHVIFQCHLAAALRYNGVSITLHEIDALWREIIDECMRLRPPIDAHKLKKQISSKVPAKSDKKNSKGSRELSLAESISFIRSDSAMRYEALCIDDFIAWERRFHPDLRHETQRQKDKLHLLVRLLPTQIFFDEFSFEMPMMAKLHALRHLNHGINSDIGTYVADTFNTSCDGPVCRGTCFGGSKDETKTQKESSASSSCLT